MATFDPVLGDLSLLPTILDNEVKALGFEGRVRYLTQRLGRTGFQDFTARLSEDARRSLLAPPLASAWVPFGPMLEVDRAIIRELMGGDPAQFKTMAMDVARADVASVYQFVLRLAGPALVLKRLSVTYSARVRPGSLVAEQLTDKSAVGRLVGGVVPWYTCEYNVAGWIAVGLEMCGAKDVEVRQTHCRHRGDEGCRWTVRWR